jgi:hypothetical protein
MVVTEIEAEYAELPMKPALEISGLIAWEV